MRPVWPFRKPPSPTSPDRNRLRHQEFVDGGLDSVDRVHEVEQAPDLLRVPRDEAALLLRQAETLVERLAVEGADLHTRLGGDQQAGRQVDALGLVADDAVDVAT